MKIGRLPVNYLGFRLERLNKRKRKIFTNQVDLYPHFIDVPYVDDDNPNHKFDVFLAKDKIKNICIIDIHGGAYIIGQHRDNYGYGQKFLEKGFDFVSIDYQLIKKNNNVIDQVRDCALCIKYIFTHLSELKLENKKFVIMGDSAGGHFALLLAEAHDNPELAKQLGIDLGGASFKAVVASCPVYDFVNVGHSLNRGGKNRLFGKHYGDNEETRLVSPRTHIISLITPLFLSTCNKDFLKQQSLFLKEDIEDQDGKIVFVYINSDAKNIAHVHNVVWPDEKESIEVNTKMMYFLKEVCK